MKHLPILLLMFIILLMFAGCKHESLVPQQSLPEVTTVQVSSITSSSALSGGQVTAEGNAPVTARGVCWATTPSPTIQNATSADGSGAGSFTSSINGLNASTTYYVRAYATNASGTAYGEEFTFTTSAGSSGTANFPVVITANINYTPGSTTAQSGGNITSIGGRAITARGVCWGTSANPTVAGDKTLDGTGAGNYSSTIRGLAPNTTYHVSGFRFQ